MNQTSVGLIIKFNVKWCTDPDLQRNQPKLSLIKITLHLAKIHPPMSQHSAYHRWNVHSRHSLEWSITMLTAASRAIAQCELQSSRSCRPSLETKHTKCLEYSNLAGVNQSPTIATQLKLTHTSQASSPSLNLGPQWYQSLDLEKHRMRRSTSPTLMVAVKWQKQPNIFPIWFQLESLEICKCLFNGMLDHGWAKLLQWKLWLKWGSFKTFWAKWRRQINCDGSSHMS